MAKKQTPGSRLFFGAIHPKSEKKHGSAVRNLRSGGTSSGAAAHALRAPADSGQPAAGIPAVSSGFLRCGPQRGIRRLTPEEQAPRIHMVMAQN